MAPTLALLVAALCSASPAAAWGFGDLFPAPTHEAGIAKYNDPYGVDPVPTTAPWPRFDLLKKRQTAPRTCGYTSGDIREYLPFKPRLLFLGRARTREKRHC